MKRRCTFCRMLIADPGAVLLSRVNSDNLSNWSKIMLKNDIKDIIRGAKRVWVCVYCVWEARLYHENTGGNANAVWWSTDDPFYKHFEAGKITKPCEVVIKKLTKAQVHHWTVEAGKKNIPCLVCGLKQSTQNAMYSHMYWKHRDKKFNMCKLCKNYINSATGMQAHFDEFHKGEISTSPHSIGVKCQFCTKIFVGRTRKHRRSQHTKKFHSELAVRCAAVNCCWYFHTKEAMEKHVEEEHKNILTKERLSCVFCDARYLSNDTLKEHLKRKHASEAHYCPIRNCRRCFKTEEEVRAHEKEIHENVSNDELIACVICGRKISSLSARVRHHMRREHSNEAYACKKIACNTYFLTKEAATEHFQATHVDKQAKLIKSCNNCEFQTKWRTSIELHIVSKHFPRILKCPECPKMFATQHHIYQHARKTHSKSKRKCPHCGMVPAMYNNHVVNTKCLKCCKLFPCFALVREHRKKCKPSYQCDICEKGFKAESNLLYHFNSVHRKTNKNVWLGANKFKGSDFKCELCKIYFQHEGLHHTHQKFFHNNIKNLKRADGL